MRSPRSRGGPADRPRPGLFPSVDRSVVKRALADSFPLFIPAIPFALVVGLAIDESGMSPLVGWTTAWIIYAGAAQLTLIALLGSGAGTAAAITAAIVINARHLMYSAALSPKFQEQPRWFRWLGPYALLDQLFALCTARMNDDPRTFRTYYVTSGLMFWTLWQVSIVIALFIGPVIPQAWNIEFAVPILFLGIVIMGIDKFPKLVAALVGAGTTYLLAGLPNRAGLLVGALAGIIVGTFAELVSSRE